MKQALHIFLAIGLLLAVLFSCSTEKNTLVSRSYHGLNAHYNGYFNATELLRESMTAYRSNRVENYYNILPIDPMPNEDEVIGMYPAIDTAITKCKKVIRDHSMPSNDRPSKKKEEHNKWIDENWTTIGIASYYRRDYEGALKSFKFVRKFYRNDPSLYIGELWMAKTYIAQGDYVKAKFNLDNLDKAIADEQERSNEKKSKKSKKDEEKIAKFPKKIRFRLELTKAELAMIKEDREGAITALESAVEHARMNDNKARVHFILGQLYAEKGNTDKAYHHFTKVLKGKATYDMSFNARLQRAFLGSGEKVRKELNKMLKDAKNAEFKDQIYYALAELEFREGDEEKGVENLTLCAFYSNRNTRQKGMAYERLGDLRFDKRDYVAAQKYYDSCATVIDDNYPNGEAIRNKAKNLSSLVTAVETAYYEDSVQRIAAMPETVREDFLKDLIKQIKAEEERRKQREAERLRELQENENLFVQEDNGNKWYWNNAKTRSEGYDEFKRLWGARENEDDWRRSEKTPKLNLSDLEETEVEDSIVAPVEDTLTVEHLSSFLPLTDSALAASNKRLLAAHYAAGLIYKDQLNEEGLAEKEFFAVLDKKYKEDPHDLLAAYQMYKMYEGKNKTESAKYKSYILDNYPTSDFANYLRDPEYFIKKKEMDALAEQEYVRVLDRYNRGLYYPVVTKANMVIEDEKDNVFRSKYMLLKALAQGQLNKDKQTLVPTLEQVIAEYPGTSEAQRANEMLEIIKNGYSENLPFDFEKKGVFSYDDKAELRVIIFLDEKQSSSMAKSKVSDFNREFFSRDKLKVSSKIYGAEQSVILVDEFENDMDAAEYIRVYKRTRKYLLDLQNAKILMITNDNLKVLFQRKNLEEYEIFHDEYY
jgi:tetratricopeptide (TPR) repeat protein